MAVDLHTHTDQSDGTDSPEQLVEKAVAGGITTLAITDHDTVSGLERAIVHSGKYQISVIPGVELSIEYDLPGDGHLHLLGLFIDYKNPELSNALNHLRAGREKRIGRILACLENLGMPFLYEEVLNEAGGGSLGRPHVADVMIKKGYVENRQQAFSAYLKKGAPAYVPKQKLTFPRAVQLIHGAGGLTLLAHPFSLGYAKYEELKEVIMQLQQQGLDGIEAYYPGYAESMQQWLHQLAAETGLALSGGSDYHGTRKPELSMGRINNIPIPGELSANLSAVYKRKFASQNQTRTTRES